MILAEQLMHAAVRRRAVLRTLSCKALHDKKALYIKHWSTRTLVLPGSEVTDCGVGWGGGRFEQVAGRFEQVSGSRSLAS